MGKALIICVDDEKIILDSLKAQLQKELPSGMRIEIAESAEEAIDIIKEALADKIDIPLVISDHIMPGMKGDEFLVRVHKYSEKTMKIMLTGQADAYAVGNALNNAKLYRYISKPWNATDLKMTVSEAIRSYYQDKKIEEQNVVLEKLVKELQQYNETLELKVKERTVEVVAQKKEIENKNEELKQQNEEIITQRDLLAEKNNSINESIMYAQRIQNAVLPRQLYIDEILPENFILFRPKDKVSGDFFWIRQINQFVIVVAADCTGHGVPGAIMSMLGISFISEIVQRREITKPSQALSELRRQVKHALRQTGKKGEPDDGMDIAFCALDTRSNILQYAGANNSIYLVQNGELQEIKADRMPIAYYPNEKPEFTNHEILLKTNDIFFLFSDGYMDQFGGEKGFKYKASNFKQLLFKNHQKTLNIQKEQLTFELENWMKGYEQTDDILVMGVRV